MEGSWSLLQEQSTNQTNLLSTPLSQPTASAPLSQPTISAPLSQPTTSSRHSQSITSITSTPYSQTPIMPLNEINWSGVYNKHPAERAIAEIRIRNHHNWFQAELGGTDRAVLRYVFPPFFCSRKITFADPLAGTETVAVREQVAISPSISFSRTVHSTVLVISTAT